MCETMWCVLLWWWWLERWLSVSGGLLWEPGGLGNGEMGKMLLDATWGEHDCIEYSLHGWMDYIDGCVYVVRY